MTTRREIDPLFDDLGNTMTRETPDDYISRLDLVRWLEDELNAVRRRMNPNGAFWAMDSARLSSLQLTLDYVEGMEGREV
jgi:hypothetical protein